MAKEAVVLISDTHINSVLALCKPFAREDDGSFHQLNKIQRWLWITWEACLNDIDTLTNDYYKNLILVGDIVDLDSKSRSWQIISKNPATVVEHAIDVLEPVVAWADITFVLRGTEAHTGKSAWAEEELARDLEAEPDPDTDSHSWWHMRAGFSGVTFDIAHHASMGRLPWTYPNGAVKLAATTMIEYSEWGEPPPDIVVRAHNHRFADSGRSYQTRGIFLPAWQFHTAYLHRIGKPNARPHIGACVFLCDDGEYRFHDLLYRPKRSPRWSRKQ
jgi:hypothetical protein